MDDLLHDPRRATAILRCNISSFSHMLEIALDEGWTVIDIARSGVDVEVRMYPPAESLD